MINNADIAILSAKRDTSFVWGYDPWYNGGVIQVDNDTFENNYIDIMFEDWNVGGICTCVDSTQQDPTIGRWFHQSISNSYFGKMADEGHCTNWQYANERIDSVQYTTGIYGPEPYDLIFNKCHIVDLAAYKMNSATQPVGGYYWNWCTRCLQYKTYDPNNINQGTNATQNNTYYENEPNHDPGCMNGLPNNNFH